MEKANYEAIREAGSKELDVQVEKAIKELGVGSEEFMRKHEAFMADCDRVSRLSESGMEDKQLICDRLTSTLKATKAAHDLMALDYNRELGVVFATFANGGTRTIHVKCDSGVAMIRDILRGLGV